MPDPTGRISHVPAMHRGVSWKQPVRVATTASVTIATALNAGDTVDGVTLAAGDRVLVKDQSTGSQNGIYLAGATPIRDFDMDQDQTTSVPAEEVLGSCVYVIAGTANGGTFWRCSNTSTPVLGTTAMTWVQFGAPTALTFATPAIVLGSAAAAGAASTVIRSDSTIAAFDATAPVTQAFSDAAAVGTAAVAARRDHKHGMPANPGGGGGGSIFTVDQDISADFTTASDSAWHDITGLTGISLVAGTWLGTIDLELFVGVAIGPVFRVYDGTTTYAQAGVLRNAPVAAVSYHYVFNMKPVTLGSTTTMAIQYFSDTALTVKQYPTRGGLSSAVATHVTFLKIA